MSHALFADVATVRRKQIASLVAHYIAGLPDVNEKILEEGLRDLAQLEEFKVGDIVTTLRKSLSGTVLFINDDGSIVWKCDQTGSTMTATPQSLIRVQ